MVEETVASLAQEHRNGVLRATWDNYQDSVKEARKALQANAEAIRETLRASGKTNAELAKILDVSRQRMGQILGKDRA